MKENKYLFSTAGILAAVLVLLSSGCSLIGFCTGAAIDYNKPDVIGINYGNEDHVKPGKKMYCVLPDGEYIKGNLKYYGEMNRDTYAKKYVQFRQSLPDSVRIPDLYDTLIVTDKTGTPRNFRFEGFNLATPGRVRTATMMLAPCSDTGVIEAKISFIESIVDRIGNSYYAATIGKGILSGDIPVVNALNILTKSIIKEVDNTTLDQMPCKYIKKTYGKFAAARTMTGITIYFNDDGAYCYDDSDGHRYFIGRDMKKKSIAICGDECLSLLYESPAPPQIRSISVNQIDYIGVEKNNRNKWIGAGLGLIPDAAMAVLIGVALSYRGIGN